MSQKRDYFVYRLFGSHGELLYIGCTKNLKRRWTEHRMERPQIACRVHQCKLQGPYTRDVAFALEKSAINREHPLFNHTPQRQAATQIREVWIKRRAIELADEGFPPYLIEKIAKIQGFQKFPNSPIPGIPWRPEGVA